MPLLFLSARHGRLGYQVQGASGQTRTLKRPWPEKGWVKERAKKHGLLHLFQEQRKGEITTRVNVAGSSAVGSSAAGSSAAGSSAAAGKHIPQRAGMTAIVGVASVAAGQVSKGILTPCTAEEVFLCEFFFEGPQSLHDFFTLQVQRVVAFRRSFETHCPMRFPSDLWEPGKIAYADLLRFSGLTRQELESGLQMDEGAVSAFKPLCLRVPLLPSHLVLKKWRALMLKGSDFCRKGTQLVPQKRLQKLQVDLRDFPSKDWVMQAARF